MSRVEQTPGSSPADEESLDSAEFSVIPRETEPLQQKAMRVMRKGKDLVSTVSSRRSSQRGVAIDNDLSQVLLAAEAGASHEAGASQGTPNSAFINQFNEALAMYEKRLSQAAESQSLLEQRLSQLQQNIVFGVILLVVLLGFNLSWTVNLTHQGTGIGEQVAGLNSQLTNIQQDYARLDDFQRLRDQVDGSVSKDDFDAYKLDASQKESHLHESISTLVEKLHRAEDRQRKIDGIVDGLVSDLQTLRIDVVGAHVHEEDSSASSSEVLKDMSRASRERDRRIADLQNFASQLRDDISGLQHQSAQDDKSIGAALQDVQSKSLKFHRELEGQVASVSELEGQLASVKHTLSSTVKDLQTVKDDLDMTRTHADQAMSVGNSVKHTLGNALKDLQAVKDDLDMTRTHADQAMSVGKEAMSSLDGVCFAKSRFHDCPPGSTSKKLFHWYEPNSWDPWCGGLGQQVTEDTMDGTCLQDRSGNRKVALDGCCRGA